MRSFNIVLYGRACLALTAFTACGFGFGYQRFFLVRISSHSSSFMKALGLFASGLWLQFSVGIRSADMAVSARSEYCSPHVVGLSDNPHFWCSWQVRPESISSSYQQPFLAWIRLIWPRPTRSCTNSCKTSAIPSPIGRNMFLCPA